MNEVAWSELASAHSHVLRALSREALERVRDPSRWACDITGSTDAVWLRVSDGMVASACEISSLEASKGAGSPRIGASSAWLSLGPSSARDLISVVTGATEATHNTLASKTGDVVVVAASAAGFQVAQVPAAVTNRIRGLSRLASTVQQALSANYAGQRGNRAKSGWALLRSAVAVMGLFTFSDKARLARAQSDLQEAAVRRMMHFDKWRAWRKFAHHLPQPGVPAPPASAASGASSAAAFHPPRRRQRDRRCILRPTELICETSGIPAT